MEKSLSFITNLVIFTLYSHLNDSIGKCTHISGKSNEPVDQSESCDDGY